MAARSDWGQFRPPEGWGADNSSPAREFTPVAAATQAGAATRRVPGQVLNPGVVRHTPARLTPAYQVPESEEPAPPFDEEPPQGDDAPRSALTGYRVAVGVLVALLLLAVFAWPTGREYVATPPVTTTVTTTAVVVWFTDAPDAFDGDVQWQGQVVGQDEAAATEPTLGWLAPSASATR